MVQSNIRPQNNYHKYKHKSYNLNRPHPGRFPFYRLAICDLTVASHRYQLEHGKGNSAQHKKIIEETLQTKKEFLAYLLKQHGIKVVSEVVQNSLDKITHLFRKKEFTKLKNYLPKKMDLSAIKPDDIKNNILVHRQKIGHLIGTTSRSYILDNATRIVDRANQKIPELEQMIAQSTSSVEIAELKKKLEMYKKLRIRYSAKIVDYSKRIHTDISNDDPFSMAQVRRGEARLKAKKNRKKQAKTKNFKNLAKKNKGKKSLIENTKNKKSLVKKVKNQRSLAKTKNQFSSQELAQAKKLLSTHQKTFKQAAGKSLLKQETITQYAKTFGSLDYRSKKHVAKLVGHLQNRFTKFQKKWKGFFSSEKTLKNKKWFDKHVARFTESVEKFSARNDAIKDRLAKLMQAPKQQVEITNPFLQSRSSIHDLNKSGSMFNRNRFAQSMIHKRNQDLFTKKSKHSHFVS